MRRRFMLSGLLAVLLVACGTAAPTVAPTPAPTVAPTIAPTAVPTQSVAAPTNTAAPSASTDRLYVQDGYGSPTNRLSVIDAGSGTRVQDLPLGVPAPDWSILYVVQRDIEQTNLRALDPLTGQTLRETTIKGRYTISEEGPTGTPRGLSPNGRWLALGSYPAYEVNAKNTIDQKSHLVVIDTAFTQSPKYVDLGGNFSFDALSNDGTSLYLIETMPPNGTSTPGLGYKVRLYDLSTATLQPGVVVDKTAISQTMSGTRQTSVVSPDGQWVYSLYLNAAGGPFIHMLNLSGRFSICLFLPKTGKEDGEKQLLWSLTQTRDGKRLYAVNGALGIVSEVDPAQLSIRRTVTLPMTTASHPGVVARIGNWLMPSASAKRFLAGGAALTSDGKTLFVIAENGLLAVDTSDLVLRNRYLPDLPLDSVMMSPDGAHLYAVSAEKGQMLSLDAATGATMKQFIIPSHQPWVILGVG